MFFRFRYFLEGATPDELKRLNAQQLQNTELLTTKLSRLQVKGIVITPKSDLWINFETISVKRLTVECHLVTLWTQLLVKWSPINWPLPYWTWWFQWSCHVFSHFLAEHNDFCCLTTYSTTFLLNTIIPIVFFTCQPFPGFLCGDIL